MEALPSLRAMQLRRGHYFRDFLRIWAYENSADHRVQSGGGGESVEVCRAATLRFRPGCGRRHGLVHRALCLENEPGPRHPSTRRAQGLGTAAKSSRARAPNLLSHGWKLGEGFLKRKWDTYRELSLLYLLAIGSLTHPIPADAWYAWRRPIYTYGHYQFVSGGPLFTHQYAHAWVDFRNRRDRGLFDFFKNSETAIRANQLYCSHLTGLPDAGLQIWGISASDGPTDIGLRRD